MTRQRLVIIDGDPKNCSYIDSGASISNLFNKELLSGLMEVDTTFKIQMGGEPIHLLQIRSQQHLMLPISTYHYNKNTISNVSPVARIVNEFYTMYNITADDNAIYVWSKEYGEYIQFPRDHKFNLYYILMKQIWTSIGVPI